MPFSEIVGHEKQLESLKLALRKDRLHHAYLFVGPEGVGKKTVALSLAMAVQCRRTEYDSCGDCVDCVRVQSGNHPDVRLIEPLEGKKEVTIQQVRELERELNYRAFVGRKKIALVDPASLINFSAQNALLKTLEEPPKDSLLILISPNTGGLLPTLLSRCLRLSFAPLPRETLARFLVTRKGLEPKEAEVLAAVTMGSVGRALAPEAGELSEKRKAWGERVGSLTSSDWRGSMALAEEISGERSESLEFLEWMQSWCRDILVYRVTGSNRAMINLDLEEPVVRQAARCSSERAIFLLSEAGKTATAIRRNVNRRIALENFLAHVAGLY